MKKKRLFYKLILFLFIFFQITIIYLYKVPPLTSKLDMSNLTSASATLSNSRYSIRAGVAGTPASGATTIDIDTSNNGDNDTNHMFVNDTICFSDSGMNGCKGQTTYAMGGTVDADTFFIIPQLATSLLGSDLAVSTSSGNLTIRFRTISTIPSGGNILLTIPAVKSTGKATASYDGIPDTAATLANNGFDLKDLVAADISVTSCTWNATETITFGNDTLNHTVQIAATAVCAAGTDITVSFTNNRVKNPAPVIASTRGQAAPYRLLVQTRDGSNNVIDDVETVVAPVEAVFVTATVDESLSFTVAGVTADSGSFCGVTRTASSPDSSAFSLPWGIVPPTYVAATHNAAQQLTVSTNANSGYKVYIEENDQMGRNGNTCTGTAPSAGEFTFGSGICIRDTVCAATACTHTTGREWGATPGTYYGVGYSLANQSGTDAKFLFSSAADPCNATAGAGNFCAKQMADTQGAENREDADAEAMLNSGSVSGSSAYVCYRINIPGTQPAGYYFNNIRYTAVATF